MLSKVIKTFSIQRTIRLSKQVVFFLWKTISIIIGSKTTMNDVLIKYEIRTEN
ncbi:uncharacterized protein METZ01_LOCUS468727 [marine metagenome]|uniref:Uncharacterized protein n=1 Tax=marine metagenome TaxID=408172 RepID=A0A383B7R3_9ZZZZ